MNKVFMAAATALLLCAPCTTPAGAQGSKVRVGPSPDETTRETPAEREQRPAAKPQPKTDKAQEAKGGAQDAKNGAKTEQKSAAQPAEKDEKKAVALSSNAATPAPVNASTPVSASDAPAKSTTDTVVPLLAPAKSDATNPSANASDAPTSNASNTSPNSSPDRPATSPNSTTAPSTTPANASPSHTTTANPNPSNTTAPGSTPAAVPVSGSPSPLTSVPPVTFSPEPVAPPTAVYRIGVGDVLDIRLLNQNNSRESTLFTVMTGGLLEYPLAGEPLVVTGMTTEELGARLSLSLKRRAVYDKPQMVVSVREYASHTVLVSGMVSDPGAKVLRREAVPLYVVIAEAQPHADAGRAVVISRQTGQTQTVDLSDAASLNVLVHAGDVVNVLPRPKEFLYIGGEIAQPGQKDFHPGMTLTQAVLASGGVTRLAGTKIRVSRQGADGRLVSTEYSLSEIESGAVPDPPLQPGDRVEVSSRKK